MRLSPPYKHSPGLRPTPTTGDDGAVAPWRIPSGLHGRPSDSATSSVLATTWYRRACLRAWQCSSWKTPPSGVPRQQAVPRSRLAHLSVRRGNGNGAVGLHVHGVSQGLGFWHRRVCFTSFRQPAGLVCAPTTVQYRTLAPTPSCVIELATHRRILPRLLNGNLF
ncbi:uncharacterized protein B0I36DRAFT_341319, partial [Microdochium trichocladiopsis]